MAIPIIQVANAVQVAQELNLTTIPPSWLELLDRNWTIGRTDAAPGQYYDLFINGHHWSWYRPNLTRYGCVCHSDPSQPDLTSTMESFVHDQGGGGSYCSHCRASLNPLERPKICPVCHRRLLKGGITAIPGGSDF